MSELIFLVEEDQADGGLSARALGESIFTQGKDRTELIANIRDAIQCHFDSPEKTPQMIRLHYVHDEVLAL